MTLLSDPLMSRSIFGLGVSMTKVLGGRYDRV